MLKDKNIVEYIEAVDSESLPGGGSVASLSGALGISLARMLAHLSVNKKKFKEAKEEERNAFIAYANDLKGYRNALIDGIDADALLLNNEQVKKEFLEESEALVIKAKNAKKTLLLKLNNH